MRLNKISTKKEQAEALFGLALHTFQDYFAHVVKATIYGEKFTKNSEYHIKYTNYM